MPGLRNKYSLLWVLLKSGIVTFLITDWRDSSEPEDHQRRMGFSFIENMHLFFKRKKKTYRTRIYVSDGCKNIIQCSILDNSVQWGNANIPA